MFLLILNIFFKINYYIEFYSFEFLNCKYMYYMFLSVFGMYYMVFIKLLKYSNVYFFLI